jgi:hypothetical protein
MSTKSGFQAFLVFMTPGRTLIALLVAFIALPGALVWTGVASFGAGTGTSNSRSAEEGSSTPSGSGAGPTARSEPAPKPERMAAASSSGGSSASAARETSRDSRAVAAPAAINPGTVAPPMANVTRSADRSQGPESGAAEVSGSGGASGTAPATSIRPRAGGSTPSVLRAIPMQPQASPKSEPSPHDQARNKTGAPPPENAPQASAADLQLEEKLRAALGARIAAGGQLTITYSGDVVEKAPAQPGGQSPAGTTGTGKPGGRP